MPRLTDSTGELTVYMNLHNPLHPATQLPMPEWDLLTGVIAASTILIIAALIILLRVALKSHGAKSTTGESGMIGLTGRAETEIGPEGTVFVRGELWRATSLLPIERGQSIRVTGIDRLTLTVEPLNPHSVMRRGISALDDS